nr:hypothetical protein [Rhodococcus sp. YH3-3]
MRIELDCITPPIWRRFSVPSNIELDQLHSIVQAVMGWGDQHAHQWVSVHHSTDNGPDRYIAPEVIERDGYQRRRRQVGLGRLTPIEYETIMTTPATQAA